MYFEKKKRMNSFLYFTKLQMVKLKQRVSVWYIFFYLSEMTTSVSVDYFYHRPVPCSVSEPCFPADDTIIQYLLAYWQSVNSNCSLCVKPNVWFQQYSDFDLMTGNARQNLWVILWCITGRMMETVWIGFVTEDFVVVIFFFTLLDNVLKVCVSVNVPCVLKHNLAFLFPPPFHRPLLPVIITHDLGKLIEHALFHTLALFTCTNNLLLILVSNLH